MSAALSAHLHDGETFTVTRNTSEVAGREWLDIKFPGLDVTLFGTPEQLDALIDQIAALRRES